METTWIPIPGFDVEICAAPVQVEDFLPYEVATQTSQKNRRRSLQQSIVGISASDANRYAAWVGQKNGHVYRLPMLSEMQALASLVKQEVSAWSCHPDPWDKTRLMCPYEWLNCAPNSISPPSILHCATHPQWLTKPYRKILKAALADDALAYVTFRLVRLR